MVTGVRRKYDVHLVLGRARPWRSVAWRRLAAVLEPVLGPPTRPAIRTNEKLGKLAWHAPARWTGAPGVRRLEVWSPSWTACARRKQPPDVFLEIVDPTLFGERPRDGVASWTLLATAVDAGAEVDGAAFAAALAPVTYFTGRSAWGHDLGGGAHEARLQYFLVSLERDRTGAIRVPRGWSQVH